MKQKFDEKKLQDLNKRLRDTLELEEKLNNEIEEYAANCPCDKGVIRSTEPNTRNAHCVRCGDFKGRWCTENKTHICEYPKGDTDEKVGKRCIHCGLRWEDFQKPKMNKTQLKKMADMVRISSDNMYVMIEGYKHTVRALKDLIEPFLMEELKKIFPGSKIDCEVWQDDENTIWVEIVFTVHLKNAKNLEERRKLKDKAEEKVENNAKLNALLKLIDNRATISVECKTGDK